MNTSTTLANYRIFDRTGGGGTEDIHAENLEEAIAAGRSWIEAGSWESSDDGIYRTITLDCCVREIVRDEDGDIDDDATADNDGHDCSGTYSDPLPACAVDPGDDYDGDRDDEGHDWQQPYSVVGGIKENPGVWSGGGTRWIEKYVCRCCGQYKTVTTAGSQRNPDEAEEIIELEDRDEKSEAWLKRIHENDDWIPQWLADTLDCPPTIRMTKEEAEEWRDDHTDDDALDREELEHAFAAIYSRRPDDDDDQWSLICAAK